MLFPYAPFISEEIYSYLPEAKKSIYEESYPQASKHAYREAELGEELVEMVKYVRQFKADSKLAPNAKVNLTLTGERKKIARLQPYLMKLAFASGFQTAEKGGEGFRYIGEIGLKAAGEETHESQELIAKRIEALKAELERSRKILTNPQFLQKAPAAKVQEEKDKQAKYQAELDKYLAAK
jgi:valyl-tRNA synthetase